MADDRGATVGTGAWDRVDRALDLAGAGRRDSCAVGVRRARDGAYAAELADLAAAVGRDRRERQAAQAGRARCPAIRLAFMAERQRGWSAVATGPRVMPVADRVVARRSVASGGASVRCACR